MAYTPSEKAKKLAADAKADIESKNGGTKQTSSNYSNNKTSSKMSESTFKKYDSDFSTWSKTGKHSDGFNSWAKKDEVDLYKKIKGNTGKSTLLNGQYLYMDNDSYDRYGRDYNNWRNNGYKDTDDTSWRNDDDLAAFKAIRGSRSDYENGFDDFRYSLNDDVIKATSEKYKKQWGDKYYYDMNDPEDVSRMANGQMPKYLEDKYDLGDVYSKFLYDNNLPYNITGTNGFSDMYSEAYNDWKAQEDYNTNYNNFLKETASKIQNATEEEIAPVVSEILTSGNYDDVAKNFRKKASEGDEWDDIITNYVKEEKSGNKFDIDDIIRDIAQYMNVPKAQAEQVVAQAIDDGTVEEVAEAVNNAKAEETVDKAVTQDDIDRYRELADQKANVDRRINEYDKKKKQHSTFSGYEEEYNELKAEQARLEAEMNALGASQYSLEQNKANVYLNKVNNNTDISMEPVSTKGWDNENAAFYNAITGVNDYSHISPDIFNSMKNLAKYCTSEEIGVLNTVAKGGEEPAKEYMDNLKTVLQARSMEADAEKYQQFAEDNGVLSSIASVPMSVVGSLEGLGNIGNNILGNRSATQAMYNGYLTRASDNIRTTVSEEIQNEYNDELVGGVTTGEALSLLYQTGLSMAETLARMPMGYAGLALAGGSAASSTMIEQLENGASLKQATILSSVAGAAEVVTEKVSLESLFNAKSAGNLGQLLGNVAKQMFVEGSEEVSSDIINTIADNIVRGDYNSIRQEALEYMKNNPGVSLQEAEGIVFGKNVATSFIGGAISGGIMGAGGQVINIAKTSGGMRTINALNKNAISPEVKQNIIKNLVDCRYSNELTNNVMQLVDEMDQNPSMIATKSGTEAIQKITNALEEEANKLNLSKAENTIKQQKAQKRLNNLLNSIRESNNMARHALEMGDKDGYANRYVPAVKEAIAKYNDEAETIKYETEKQNLKEEQDKKTSEKKIADVTADVAENVGAMKQAEADLTQNVVEEIQTSNEQNIEAEESMPEAETIENSTVLEPNNGILEAETVQDNNQVKEEVNNVIPDNREGRNADSETIETGRTGEEPAGRNISTEVQQEELSRVNNGFHPFNEYEPEYEQEVIGRTRTVLGKPADNVCMYTRDENVPKDINGFAVNGRSYVEYTGNKTDIGFVWHEIAHNSKGIRNGILEAIKSTGNYDGILESYRGATTDPNVEAKTNAEIEEELLCDAFGAYALYRTLDIPINGISEVLGMSDAETESVFDSISEMLANGIEEDEEFDRDNAIKYSSVEYSANDLLRKYREAKTPETREGIQGIAQEKIRSTEKSIADKLIRDISKKWNISYRSVNSESSEIRKSVHEFVENFVDGDLEEASKSAENIVERIVNDITDKGYSQEAVKMVGDEETADFLANEIKNATFAITYHDGEKTVGKSIREESKGIKWRKNGGVYLDDWWASMRSEYPGLPDKDEESLAPFLSDFYRAYKEDRISLEQAYANEGGYGEIKDIIKEEVLPMLADWENKHMTEMSIANGTASTDEQLEFEKQNAKRSQLQEDAARRFDRKQEILKKADDATFNMMQKLSGSENQNEAINGGLLELQRAGADKEVINQVRGNLLRNGYGVGGLRSDKAMEPISKNMKFFKKIGKLIVKSPARVLREFAQYADTNVKGAEEFSRNVCLNMRASDEMESNYFMYQQNHLMEQNLFKRAKSTEVADIGANDSESILAQLLGEELITENEAKNAVTDGKYTLIPKGTGAMILKNKNGRIHMMADGESVLSYTDNVVKSLIERQKAINEIRNDGKPNSAERIAELKKTGIGSVANTVTNKLEQDGNTYKIVNADGDVLFEMQSNESAFSDKTLKLRDTLKSIYDEMYEMANETLLVNGYGGLNKRSNYMPHFTSSDTGLNGFIQFMHSEDLPVSIAGITGEFSPGKPWNGHMLERIGDETDYHAINGFNNYLGGVSNVIFQTPVIQRYRQLENLIRTGKSSKTGEQYSTNQELSGFVSWLHDYTNLLANKKSAMDRTVESWVGRKAYTLPGKITGTIGAAQIGMNINSALTNAAAMFEGAGKVKPKNFGKAVADTISAMVNGSIDDFNDKCAFLVNRQSKEEETITNLGGKVRAKGEKVLFGLSEAVDDFSTNIIARAKYYELIEEGYGKEAALNKTTMFCNDLFAERSKGSKPSIFESRVIAPIVQYQIEPLNMLWHASDVHKENMYSEYRRILKQNNGVLQGIDFGSAENQISKAGIANKDIRKFLGMIIGLSAYGMIKRLLTGRDATWNPLGIVLDTVNGAKDDGFGGAVSALGDAVKENAPFGSAIESVANMFTGNDSSSASIPVPALSAISSAVNDIKKGDIFGLFATFAPGGGQVRKTKNGLQAVAEGGKYTSDGRLQYPVDQNGFNYAKGALFGTTALQPYGYDYYSDTLNEKETELYEEAVSKGLDKQTVYGYLLNGYDKNATVDESTKKASLLVSDLEEDEQKLMAEVLGIKWTNEEDTKKELESFKEETEKKHNKVKKDGSTQIGDDTYNKRMSAIDYYMEMLF